jgi:hypothetical protein
VLLSSSSKSVPASWGAFLRHGGSGTRLRSLNPCIAPSSDLDEQFFVFFLLLRQKRCYSILTYEASQLTSEDSNVPMRSNSSHPIAIAHLYDTKTTSQRPCRPLEATSKSIRTFKTNRMSFMHITDTLAAMANPTVYPSAS